MRMCRTTVSGASVRGLCPCDLHVLAANSGPLPGRQPCPLAPRLAGGSVFGTMRTLWCAGGGAGSQEALIIFATPRGRWPWTPRVAGGAGRGLHCPASPPLCREREGSRAGAPVSWAGPGRCRQADVGGSFPCPLSLGGLEMATTLGGHRHTGLFHLLGPNPGPTGHSDTEQLARLQCLSFLICKMSLIVKATPEGCHEEQRGRCTHSGLNLAWYVSTRAQQAASMRITRPPVGEGKGSCSYLDPHPPHTHRPIQTQTLPL